MDKKAIESHISAAVLKRIGAGKEVEITRESRFADLGIDSLDVIEMLFEAEEEYGVRFSDEAARTLVTIGDVVAYIVDQKATALAA